MKFIFNKDLRDNRAFSFLLSIYSLMTLLFYSFMFYLEKVNFGLLPNNILSTISGNKELLIPALSLQEIVLHNHIKLFLYMFSSLVLLIIFIRTDTSDKNKINYCYLVFSLLLIDVLASFLILWHPFFSHLKSVSFFSLQLISIILCLHNLIYLNKKP